MDKSLINQIHTAAEEVLLRFSTKYTPAIRDYVVKILLQTLGERPTPIVYPDDEETIQRKLTFDNVPLSNKSLSHQHFYSTLIGDLDSKGTVKGRPLNIPQKITRDLILTPENNLDEHIRYVQKIHDDLLEFRELPDDLKEAEIDSVCMFIASAAIFAKITFPKLHVWILSIQFKDIYLEPDFINWQEPNSEAFFRYFLPYPANVYFMQCIRFYQKNHIRLKSIKPRWRDDRIFQSTFINHDNISGLFKEWITKRINAQGGTLTTTFRVSSFYKAVRAASMIDLSPAHEAANRIPPFIIAIHAGIIPCYSYENRNLSRLLDTKISSDDVLTHRGKHRKSHMQYRPLVKAIFRQICHVRRSLLTQIDSTPLREKTIDNISSIVEKESKCLSEGDAYNIALYVKWLESRLLDKNEKAREEYLDFKSFNDQAPMVESLIENISGYGAIDEIPPDEIEDVIRYDIYTDYTVHNVRDVLISFTKFVQSVTKKVNYEGPNWSSDELKKVNVPRLKVFIPSLMVERAVEYFEDALKQNILQNYEDSEEQKRLMPIAVYNARVLGMMTELAFFTGMRIHEITLLQIRDVLYSDGFVIRVDKTKTDAGERNIPLSLLALRSFVERFAEFWKERKKEVTHEGLLFVQFDGKVWETSDASKHIASIFRLFDQRVKFHNLRDAFASILILRWFVAFHHDLLPQNAPFLSEELFNEENLSNFKKLVLGMGDYRKYQDDITHIQAVLAKILGHIGPMTSFESYVHVVDLLFFFFTKQNVPDNMELSCKVAEDLLQITYPSLPEVLKGRGKKTIKTLDFLQIQRDLVDLPKPKKPVPRKTNK